MNILKAINDFMYKDKYVCALCGDVFDADEKYVEIVTGNTGICLECIGSMPFINNALKYYSKLDPQTEIFIPLFYKGVIRQLMHDFKFNGMHEYSSVIAYIICYRFDEPHIKISARYDMIAPIPLSEERMRERGYNQSALIAEKVAKYFHMEYNEYALKRVRNTKRQSLASTKEERYTNVHGAFSADPDIVSGKRVLIFDDIYTYGYTMNECVRAVKSAGGIKTGAMAAALASDGSRILL